MLAQFKRFDKIEVETKLEAVKESRQRQHSHSQRNTTKDNISEAQAETDRNCRFLTVELESRAGICGQFSRR